jgi:hypothetical protein
MELQLERYERELAGTGFVTLPPAGWDFESFNGEVEEEDDRTSKWRSSDRRSPADHQ